MIGVIVIHLTFFRGVVEEEVEEEEEEEEEEEGEEEEVNIDLKAWQCGAE
jgi:hypothetical protein